MKLSIYDPRPPCNEYLSKMYFGPLRSYCSVNGITVEEVGTLESVKDSLVLVAGDHLSHDRLSQLKNNGNKICVFDINDSSSISSTYFGSPLIPEIDLILKVSGVVNRNTTLEPGIDANFNITSSEVKFLPDEDWEIFDRMRLSGRIRSLPYTLWEPLVQAQRPVVSKDKRNGKVLVGGGNHFWRVILFFKLVQRGMDDPTTQFATNAYFADNMTPQFRYCGECRAERKAHGRTPYSSTKDPNNCTSTAKWGDPEDIVGGPGTGKSQFGHWNNRCPASFFWLAKEYERLSGPLNPSIERALNGTFRGTPDFIRSLEHASFYADYKWLNTIYAPPRFWEAASVGTVNLYPRRTAHQDYWPHIQEGVHYKTYPEDMSEFEVGLGDWNEVSRAAKDLYESKIRGTRFPISNALLEHIISSIKETCL